MQAISNILPVTNSQLAIGVKKVNPIGNRTNSVIVDRLLEDYKDLIEPSYAKWFAKCFYDIQFDQLHRAASEARQDGKNQKRMFAFLVKKLASERAL